MELVIGILIFAVVLLLVERRYLIKVVDDQVIEINNLNFELSKLRNRTY